MYNIDIVIWNDCLINSLLLVIFILIDKVIYGILVISVGICEGIFYFFF